MEKDRSIRSQKWNLSNKPLPLLFLLRISYLYMMTSATHNNIQANVRRSIKENMVYNNMDWNVLFEPKEHAIHIQFNRLTSGSEEQLSFLFKMGVRDAAQLAMHILKTLLDIKD